MNVREYIRHRIAMGRPSFSVAEIEKETGLGHFSLLKSLGRLSKKGEIASPYQGFYVAVPDEYSLQQSLPADQMTVLLMDYLRQDYYVGLLSAAQYYGAAHQKPQTFQVMVKKARPDISCGKAHLSFISRKNLSSMPVKLFKNQRGFLKVSTPESTAVDLISYPRRSGGLDNVATVLKELAEHIDAEKLIELTSNSPDTAWIQRLGYIFSFLDLDHLSLPLLSCLQKKKTYFSPLSSHEEIRGFERDPTWKIIVNHKLEPDL